MIVCSCNVIRHSDIDRVIRELHARDPGMLITPGVVFKALGFRAQCGTCLASVCEQIVDAPAPSPPRLAKFLTPAKRRALQDGDAPVD